MEYDGLMNLQEQMETIYQELTLEKIPWNLKEPPQLLVELVESGQVLPCEAVDLGCGAGNYAVWLASRGFRMTGIDISPKAIELAGHLASKKGVTCRFIVEDLTGDLGKLDHSFDFAYDWEVLHHIFPVDRERYVSNVYRLLRPGGRYLSVCFSEEDPDFGGEGKYRKTPLGTTLYFSSEQELRDLFEPDFHIHELGTSEIAGKYGPHMAVIVLMERE
jgi:SAM-dependent methyltransferase